MSNEAAKKALSITAKVLTWIVIAITVFMMIFTIVSTIVFDKNDRSLFGLRFYIVLSDSMSPSEKNADDEVHFYAGDIVLIGEVDDATALQPGDVIAFISHNSDSFGETVTHMIREVRKSADGRVLGYVTYGTNTGAIDEALVEPEYVLGSYSGRLPGLGYFFQFLKSTPGYIVCILIPFLILILYNGANVIKLFRRYKKEQMAVMEAERAEIAKEREESAKMLLELQALKEQLAKQAQGESPAPAPEAPKSEENSESKEEIPAETEASTEENNN